MSVATTAQASLQRDWAVITAAVAGVVDGTSEERGIGQAGIDSPAQDALKKIDAIYETDEAVGTQIVVRIEAANVLTPVVPPSGKPPSFLISRYPRAQQ